MHGTGSELLLVNEPGRVTLREWLRKEHAMTDVVTCHLEFWDSLGLRGVSKHLNPNRTPVVTRQLVTRTGVAHEIYRGGTWFIYSRSLHLIS